MHTESNYMAGSSNQYQSMEEDLLMLREDLAEEWGSVIGYLECSIQVRDCLISEQFRMAAQDEIENIIRLTRMLAILDQVQAEALQRVGLFWLVGFDHQTALRPLPSESHSQAERENQMRPGKRYYGPDGLTLECLRNAIRDELLAINVYQRQARATANPMVQNLITIMNQKKVHVALFTASLQNLLREYRLSMG